MEYSAHINPRFHLCVRKITKDSLPYGTPEKTVIHSDLLPLTTRFVETKKSINPFKCFVACTILRKLTFQKLEVYQTLFLNPRCMCPYIYFRPILKQNSSLLSQLFRNNITLPSRIDFEFHLYSIYIHGNETPIFTYFRFLLAFLANKTNTNIFRTLLGKFSSLL